jgi:hypothetical protein
MSTNGKERKAKDTNGNGSVRVTTELTGVPANHFQRFKENFGIRNDAEALRQLATQRLAQLKKRGQLAKAA